MSVGQPLFAPGVEPEEIPSSHQDVLVVLLEMMFSDPQSLLEGYHGGT